MPAAFYFDLPNPGAISHAWLAALLGLAWWYSASVPILPLACIELICHVARTVPAATGGGSSLPVQDAAAAAVLLLCFGLTTYSLYSRAFGLAYALTWARVYPQTLWGFASTMAVTTVLTASSTHLMANVYSPMPLSPAQVTAQWLESSKHPAFSNILKFRMQGSGGSGFIGETAKLRVTRRSGGGEDAYIYKTSVSNNLAIKIKMRGSVKVYWREFFFYQNITPKLREKEGAAQAAAGSASQMLQVPDALINQYDWLTGTSVLVMPDECCSGNAGGALEPGSELVGCTWQQAVSVAARYAQFHSLHWSPSLDALDTRHPALRVLGTFDWMDGHPLVLGQLSSATFREVLEDADLRKCAPYALQQSMLRFMRHLPLVLQHIKSSRQFTLVHADARAENMLFPKQQADDGASAADYVVKQDAKIDESYCDKRWLAIDFQTLTKSMGIYDLAYFVSLELTCEPGCDATPDRTLIAYYLDKLREGGVQGYGEKGGVDEVFGDYQLSLMIAALVPCVVMSTQSIGGDNADRARRTRLAMLQRSFACIQRCGAAQYVDALLDKLLFAHNTASALAPAPRSLVTALAPPPHSTGVPRAEDDAFSHHTEESVAKLSLHGIRGLQGTSRLEAYDRWFLNGYSPDGQCYFALACGFYPGRGVVDASFAVTYNGVQHNVRATRLSYQDDYGSTSTTVGPIQVDVLEPLRRGRIRVKHENIECELEFNARFDAVLEPKFDMRIGSVMQFDYSRLTQLVSWKGKLELVKDKKHFELSAAEGDAGVWNGTRDRSWGQRPHPNADKKRWQRQAFSLITNNAVVRHLLPASAVQFYWIWFPLNFAKLGGVALHSQETGDGTQSNCAVSVFDHNGKGGKRAAKSAQLNIQYLPGTRHIRTCHITVQLEDGGRLEIESEPQFPFFMSGVGYGSLDQSHGSLPEGGRASHVSYDEILLAYADRNHTSTMQIQEVSKLRVRAYNGQGEQVGEEDVGMGILEQYVLGPHSPSGFKGFYGV